MNSKEKRKQKKRRKDSWRRRYRRCTALATKIGLYLIHKTQFPLPPNWSPYDRNNLYSLKVSSFMPSTNIVAEGDFFYLEEMVERMYKLKAFL